MSLLLMMVLAAFCGAWLAVGVSYASGGTQIKEVIGEPSATTYATRTSKIRHRVAFHAKATGLMMAQMLIGPPAMARRWLKNRWLQRERSSPISGKLIAVGAFDMDKPLDAFTTHPQGSISLERIIGECAPIDTREMHVGGGSPVETTPRDSALSGTSLFHDERSPVVQLQ